jgi:hypothetical protein
MVSDLRCPRCGAVRRDGDQWCGLCFADFRQPPPTVVGDVHQPPPAPEGAPAAPSGEANGAPLIQRPDQPAPPPPQPAIPTQSPATASATPFVPSANPLAPPAVVPTQLPAGVAPAATVDQAAGEQPAADAQQTAEPEPEGNWPCARCGIDVPLSEDSCPACGAGFLEGVGSGGMMSVPLLGDVRRATSSQKLMFGLAIAVGILLGLLLLFTLGGMVFH